jgi:NADH:ubiquinone oxidoreductase subunit
MYFLKKVLEKVFLKINGAEFVFEDYYGNQYFELKKKKDHFGQNMRYVKYVLSCNASFVPSFCDQWIRYNLDNDSLKKANETFAKTLYLKPHKPNFTGTKFKFFPKFHPISRQQNKVKLKTLYDEWMPE